MANALKSKSFWFETALYLIVMVVAFNLLFTGFITTDHEAKIALRGIGVGVAAGILMKHLLDSLIKK